LCFAVKNSWTAWKYEETLEPLITPKQKKIFFVDHLYITMLHYILTQWVIRNKNTWTN
jgi:hypothetical protein